MNSITPYRTPALLEKEQETNKSSKMYGLIKNPNPPIYKRPHFCNDYEPSINWFVRLIRKIFFCTIPENSLFRCRCGRILTLRFNKDKYNENKIYSREWVALHDTTSKADWIKMGGSLEDEK